MRQLREKLNSHRGATILLALLFLLLCMMVAATILMAAVSNAGKAQRSRTEQQKYLTLSSALGFVCDQLEKAEYKGRYTYAATDEPDIGAIPDPDTGDYKDEDMHQLHTYEQLPAELTADINALKALSGDLDVLCAGSFYLSGTEEKSGDEYRYLRVPTPVEGDPTRAPHGMSLEVDLTDDQKATYPGLSEKVTVTAELRPTGVIHLIATLGAPDAGGYQYTMEAEMNPVQKPREVLKPVADPKDPKTAEDGTKYYQTQPLTWKLGWVSKQEEVAEP